MTTGFKAFGHDGIHAGEFAFFGKAGIGHHMHNGDALFLQHGRPGCRVAGAGKHNLHAFLQDNLHVFVDIRIEQGHIHPERFVGGLPAFADLFAQDFRVHAAAADETQAAGIGNGRCQFPAAAPDHAALDDGVLYAEKPGDAVVHTAKVRSAFSVSGGSTLRAFRGTRY